MYHRIMELLVLLMDEYGSKTMQTEQMDHISEDLVRRGYTEQEINTAFFWLQHRFWGDESQNSPRSWNIQEPGPASYRIQNSLEKRYLSPAAFGYLLHLQNLRLINLLEMEAIIERAFMYNLLPIGLEEIKMVAQSVLFEDNLGGNGIVTSGTANRSESFH